MKLQRLRISLTMLLLAEALLIAIMFVTACVMGAYWKAALLSSLFLFSYYALILSCLSRTSFFRWLREAVSKLGIRSILVGLCVSIAFVFAVCFYISRSKTILFWDNGMYWYSALETNLTYGQGVKSVLNNIYSSILNSDYNLLPTMLLSLPVMMANTYVAFIGWNIVLFYLPLSVLICWFCGLVDPFSQKDYSDSSNRKTMFTWLYALLFAPMVIPVISGFVDISVVLLCLVLFSMVYDINFFKKDAISAGLFGLLLGCTFLMRRYFVYLDLGLLVGFGILTIARTLGISSPDRGLAIKQFLLNAVVAVLALLAPLLLFFGEFVSRSIFNNYGTAYSAYVLYSGFWSRLGSYIVNSGPVFVLLALFGLFIVISKRRETALRSVVLLISALVSLAAFLRTQDFSVQHYYVIDIELLVLSYLGFEELINELWRGKQACIFGALVCFSVIATSLHMTGVISVPSAVSDEFGHVWYKTTVRNDLDELNRMNRDLEGYAHEDGGSVYINASSNVLNSSIVMRSYAPEDLYPPYQLEATCDIDLRDGFPVGFLRADYVVVCDPVQTHVPNVSTQSVITTLNSCVMDESGVIGKSYKLLSKYHFDDGVTAYLYRRLNPFDKEQIDYLKDVFEKLYPDDPALFQSRIAEFSN